MKTFTLAILPLALISAFSHAAEEKAVEQAEVDTVYVTAEKQLQQSLGVSRISKDDIDKRPAVNDISEFVRTMPGVNLTGNTATGQRGNKRQIDLRGMGPENTLILIDGKPVNSRQSERISMRGERNTRGDSNWVPVEEIESITVLRGPAATRYGSGAMGGVVNIVTKKVSKEFKGQVNLYANQPQDSKEGATRRIGFNLSGPIIQDTLGFRIYGNLNKTDADAADINAGHGNDSAAGVEGVRNKDIAGRLQWKISPAQTLILDSSYSRQGNIYNGDTQNSNPRSALVNSLADSKAETARLYRSAYSLTHDGAWEWGDTKNVISYERTVNSHLPEGLAGGPEGSYTGLDFVQSRLKNLRFSSEANIPFKLGVDNVLTVGAEFTDSKLDDPASNTQGFKDQGKTDAFNGISATRGSKASQRNWAAYVEGNISLTDKTHLIPAIRFDHNSDSGSNWSPALNFSHQIGENWLVKGGVARAYKAPNLYQTNPDFILYTRGQGCPLNAPNSVRCYYMGNSNLKPETSINKEIGLEFNKNGWQASATYFHNAYRNKIVIGDQLIATSNIGNWLLQWENTPKATISGIEGNLVIPLHDTLKWSNNFTYMHKSEDYQGNPLSLVPKHTINSTLSWTPNERFDANLTFTHYGRTKPRGVAVNRLEQNGNPRAGVAALSSEHNQTQVGSYGIWGINAGYNWNKRVALRGGISNLFDKKLYRTTAGAQTYNEHGRAFYGSLKVSF
ncbi:TPA: FepA family TonB-dependent siderophore receptor [Neisseria subflava]|jgi:tonB-dependent siderophore receptor|uniref:FepA family TonB-dependent siderophore receptor n=2 Tax=Neisseria TaxID=482 RepID=UPI0008A6380B|nr:MULTISPECIES: FepA family TonB-dependent siderophore receptor [unclassified Neisseria]OFK83478.1 outer membrane receptor protein [Neisseria sp. HMSC061E12]OFP75220.1 outer membrane receptor protein [Neisseria sp. HMSC066B07]OHO82228.1 outer membrane receptor protein [Neisseria sp. HMSC056A04]OHQ24576.1 outer membrane receptor protein [Neisseria sp. HMSC066F04]OHR20463.1 outer membrane receptor protein [Neisseria sp. HMSC078H04]